jgi:hypothetical protein
VPDTALFDPADAGGHFLRPRQIGGFDNPFGNSFQAYLGEVINATCPLPLLRLAEKTPTTWALRRCTALTGCCRIYGPPFIESKTKRLTVNAKALSDAVGLDRIVVMATAILQHYRNIRDALDGKTRWKDGLPVFPLVLTLEDWLI